MAKVETVRNEKGETFSKWKPAEKFAYCWEQESPDGGEFIREFEFDPERKWRWDFAWPDFKVAVEIDGFGHSHQQLMQIAGHAEKQNAGIEQGWLVLRYTSRNLGSRDACSEAVRQVLRIICRRSLGEGWEQLGDDTEDGL